MNNSNLIYRQRLALLTPREKEVFKLLGKGLSNKIVAPMLGVTERTIEAHRARILRKMKAKNLVHLLYLLIPFSEFD